MAAIGYVTKLDNGTYKGRLETLTIKADITITPASKEPGTRQPDYRITSGRVEIGAGWTRSSERTGEEYVSLSLAAPEFGRTRLYANLARAAGGADDDYVILWNPVD